MTPPGHLRWCSGQCAVRSAGHICGARAWSMPQVRRDGRAGLNWPRPAPPVPHPPRFWWQAHNSQGSTPASPGNPKESRWAGGGESPGCSQSQQETPAGLGLLVSAQGVLGPRRKRTGTAGRARVQEGRPAAAPRVEGGPQGLLSLCILGQRAKLWEKDTPRPGSGLRDPSGPCGRASCLCSLRPPPPGGPAG